MVYSTRLVTKIIAGILPGVTFRLIVLIYFGQNKNYFHPIGNYIHDNCIIFTGNIL